MNWLLFVGTTICGTFPTLMFLSTLFDADGGEMLLLSLIASFGINCLFWGIYHDRP